MISMMTSFPIKRVKLDETIDIKTCAVNLQSSILVNNISRCHDIIQPLSADDRQLLINTEIERNQTFVHLAAEPNVELEIWQLILPYYSRNIWHPVLSALSSLIIDVDFTQHTTCNLCHIKPLRQLQKIRFWLELTKDVFTENVITFRCMFLCKLCRLEGGGAPEDATMDDILCLAKDLIEKYKADPNGCDKSNIPLHSAMLTSHISLLSLFIMHGADVNCVDHDGNTPLHYAAKYQSSKSFEIACLMVDHGAKLNAESPYNAFHAVMVGLDPNELDAFLVKYLDIITIASSKMLPFPILHGLLLQSIAYSKYRSDRVGLQKSIVYKTEILLIHGLPLKMQDIHGRTILHYACWFRYALVVEFLVSLDHTLIQVPDSFGRLCIHYTVAYPSTTYAIVDEEVELSTVIILINYLDKQLLQTVDSLGRKIQHISVFENNVRALTYLMDLGFDKDVEDNDSKSLKYYAEYLQNDCLLTMKSTKVKRNHRDLEELRINFLPESTPSFNEDLNTFEGLNSTNFTSGRDFVTKLLNNRRIGALKMTRDINNITEDVMKLVNKIAFELNKRDPRFQCDVVLAGSMSEQTKTNPPDEFDFQFRLNVLSKLFYVDRIKSCDSIILGVEIQNNIDITDILEKDKFVSACIYKAFNETVYNVISCIDFWKDVPFYWCCCKVVKTASPGQLAYISNELITPLQVKWIGMGQADVNISIDLVPVLVMERLSVDQDRIPRKIRTFVQKEINHWHIVCRDAYGARLSFLDVERFILLRLVPELREVYQLAKSLRTYCDMQSDYDFDIITSYMLKNALIDELDPDRTYCLLENQLVSTSFTYPLQDFVLTMLTQGVKLPSKDKIPFIYFWTFKILDRIERNFAKDCGKDIENRMYCCPSDEFLTVFIFEDHDDESPYLQALNIMKSTLGTLDTF